MTGRFLACAILALLPLSAVAQTSKPSFDCGRAATETEFAICRDNRLSDLDLEMFVLFDRARKSTEGPAFRRLHAHQAIWRDWRNTCGADRNCLTRRYVDRILDFDPSRAATVSTGDPDAPIARRLREGRYETVWPDGRITYVNANGDGGGTIGPGSDERSSYSYVQILPDDFPTLPGAANPWVEQVEIGLVGIVKSMLPPENHAEYDTIHAGRPLNDRVFRHIDAIGFLTGE